MFAAFNVNCVIVALPLTMVLPFVRLLSPLTFAISHLTGTDASKMLVRSARFLPATDDVMVSPLRTSADVDMS